MSQSQARSMTDQSGHADHECSDREVELLMGECVEERAHWASLFPQIRFGSLEFELLLRLYLKTVPAPINILADRTGAPVRAVETAAEKLRKAGLVTISNGKVSRFYRRVELSHPGRERLRSYLAQAVGQRRVHRWGTKADRRQSLDLPGGSGLFLLFVGTVAILGFLWYRSFTMTTILVLAGIAAAITFLVRMGLWALDNTPDLKL